MKIRISIEIESGPSCLLKSGLVVLTVVRVVFWSVVQVVENCPSYFRSELYGLVIFSSGVAYNIDKF